MLHWWGLTGKNKVFEKWLAEAKNQYGDADTVVPEEDSRMTEVDLSGERRGHDSDGAGASGPGCPQFFNWQCLILK